MNIYWQFRLPTLTRHNIIRHGSRNVTQVEHLLDIDFCNYISVIMSLQVLSVVFTLQFPNTFQYYPPQNWQPAMHKILLSMVKLNLLFNSMMMTEIFSV